MVVLEKDAKPGETMDETQPPQAQAQRLSRSQCQICSMHTRCFSALLLPEALLLRGAYARFSLTCYPTVTWGLQC